MLMFKYLKTNLRAAMEYRASFFVTVFTMVLNNASFIVFWLLLLGRIGGELNGYGFGHIMYLWSVASAGFGLSMVFFGNGRQLSQLIINGDIDPYLLQPVALVPNILGSRMQVSGLGDIMYGVLLFLCTQSLSLKSVVLYLVFIVLSGIMFTAVFLLFHSLTFFFGDAEAGAQLASEAFLSFSIYPGSVFEGPSRYLLHSLIPVAWAAWIPAELAVGTLQGAGFWGRLGVVALVDMLFVAGSVWVFYAGLKRYESGNRVGARI